jgi:hypothetical protein
MFCAKRVTKLPDLTVSTSTMMRILLVTFDADPDADPLVTLMRTWIRIPLVMRIRILTFTLMRSRIRLLASK